MKLIEIAMLMHGMGKYYAPEIEALRIEGEEAINAALKDTVQVSDTTMPGFEPTARKTKTQQYNEYVANGGKISVGEWEMDGRYDQG